LPSPSDKFAADNRKRSRMSQERGRDMGICVIVYCVMGVRRRFREQSLNLAEQIIEQTCLMFIRYNCSRCMRDTDNANSLLNLRVSHKLRNLRRKIDELSSFRGSQHQHLAYNNQPITRPFTRTNSVNDDHTEIEKYTV